MTFVGQTESTSARRVTISLGPGLRPCEHDTRSAFGDFDAMRQIARPHCWPGAVVRGAHERDVGRTP
jgi:hypothetical protein